MEAGRELDALVAVKVMKWRVADHPEKHGTGQWMSEYAFPVYYNEGGQFVESCRFAPSDDITAAMQVIEKMRDSQEWCRITIKSDYNYNWRVAFTHQTNDAHEPATAYESESLPLAISLAALQCVDLDTEGKL